MSEIKIQKVSVKGVFRRGDKFLVLKEANEWWELPGGRIEMGETIEACFAREIEEELGWKNIKFDRIAHVWSLNIDKTKTQFVVVCVTAESSDEEIKLSDEHIEYKWLTIDEIEKIKMYPDFIMAIKKSVEE